MHTRNPYVQLCTTSRSDLSSYALWLEKTLAHQQLGSGDVAILAHMGISQNWGAPFIPGVDDGLRVRTLNPKPY